MVNDAKSGKTMAFLPILLSFIMEQKDRYSKLLKLRGGPFVVILCRTSKRCEEIQDLINPILHKYNTKCTSVTKPGYINMSKLEILITMPTALLHMISVKATDYKRVCHFVLEDADIILKSHNKLIEKFLNLTD
ncbi:unnamed protein product [Ceutorhynchus assimilis]|uniref:RNA helicase n=1 Tax=Ceutorhynchus assimilis TaxID=467358 RepID=A0A9N9MBJ7_9CUCU|nr:unnamed protein product [Ceutorhynchus assimilis]